MIGDMLFDDLVGDTDSYKACHWLTFPPDVTGMMSYLESRGGLYPGTVFFGLQYLLLRYLARRVTLNEVRSMANFFLNHGVPFHERGWTHVAQDHGGALAVRIRAVPEGTVVPVQNVLLTCQSLCAGCYWTVSYIETMLMRLWYPTTVATLSWHIRATIMGYLRETADDAEGEIPFKLHDFGSRGVSSRESAAIGGGAHLVSFRGGDTTMGCRWANEYYRCAMAGSSIPAAEHSSIIMWGGPEHEREAFENMLHRFAEPGKMVAVVSDSHNLWEALRTWGDLKQAIVASKATVVIRPDSGDPTAVVAQTITRLMDGPFGFERNTKGFRVLPPYLRVIQGDGINHDSIKRILGRLCNPEVNISASNIAFGMGGALLQGVNRDTQEFAYKCCAVWRGDEMTPVQKNPATDAKKASKAGALDLLGPPPYMTWANPRDATPHRDTALQTVYEHGEVLVDTTLDEVRRRAGTA